MGMYKNKPPYTVVTILLQVLMIRSFISSLLFITIYSESVNLLSSIFIVLNFVALVGVSLRQLWGPILKIISVVLGIFASILNLQSEGLGLDYLFYPSYMLLVTLVTVLAVLDARAINNFEKINYRYAPSDQLISVGPFYDSTTQTQNQQATKKSSKKLHYCPNCGTQTSEEDGFCVDCGHRLN